MKKIEIETQKFFELLKNSDTSMWEIFSQMIDGEEKELLFLDEKKNVMFNYILPSTLEKLEEDREKFTQEFAQKISMN